LKLTTVALLAGGVLVDGSLADGPLADGPLAPAELGTLAGTEGAAFEHAATATMQSIATRQAGRARDLAPFRVVPRFADPRINTPDWVPIPLLVRDRVSCR
jgi:hypothetical protein